jgi:hypothetical protein
MVEIASGANGPNLFSLITISHFTILRLWEITALGNTCFLDSRVPKIFLH